MLVLFAVILGGIVTGRLLQSRRLAFVSRLIVVIIWALLFLLGLEVGSDPAVVGGMATLRLRDLRLLGRGKHRGFMAVVAAYPGPQCFRDGGRRGKSGICRLCFGSETWDRRRGLRCELLFRDCCGYIFRNVPESGGVWRVMLC